MEFCAGSVDNLDSSTISLNVYVAQESSESCSSTLCRWILGRASCLLLNFSTATVLHRYPLAISSHSYSPVVKFGPRAGAKTCLTLPYKLTFSYFYFCNKLSYQTYTNRKESRIIWRKKGTFPPLLRQSVSVQNRRNEPKQQNKWQTGGELTYDEKKIT